MTTSLDETPILVRSKLPPKIKDPEQFAQRLDLIYANPELIVQDELEELAPRHRNSPGDSRRRLTTKRAGYWAVCGHFSISRAPDALKTNHNQAAELRQQAREKTGALKMAHGRINQVESELTETQQQLVDSEKLSAVGLVAASVAHDIRNNLDPTHHRNDLADQDDSAARREFFELMKK